MAERAIKNQERASQEGRAEDEKVWWTVVMAAREAVQNLRAARARNVRKKANPRSRPPVVEPKPPKIRRDWLGVPEKLE